MDKKKNKSKDIAYTSISDCIAYANNIMLNILNDDFEKMMDKQYRKKSQSYMMAKTQEELTIGDFVYLLSNGTVSKTPPIEPGSIVQPVGYAAINLDNDGEIMTFGRERGDETDKIISCVNGGLKKVIEAWYVSPETSQNQFRQFIDKIIVNRNSEGLYNELIIKLKIPTSYGRDSMNFESKTKSLILTDEEVFGLNYIDLKGRMNRILNGLLRSFVIGDIDVGSNSNNIPNNIKTHRINKRSVFGDIEIV